MAPPNPSSAPISICRSVGDSVSGTARAPSNPSSAPTRSRCPLVVSDGRELPFDLMLEVLVRVPGKDLCRLRVVCRRWRAATADPNFIREHAARHRDPLVLANLLDDEAHIHVMDLSGAVVKRISVPAAHQLLCTRLDLACVATGWNSCRVLDPASGAIVPGPPVLWHGRIRNLISSPRYSSFAFGKVAATGEYKVLRAFSGVREKPFEVFTISGGTNDACWRRMQSPDLVLQPRSAVVVDAVVYFLHHWIYSGDLDAPVDPDCIASFDLETEQWRRNLQGPVTGTLVLDEEEDMYQYISMPRRLTLAELKGTLVLAYYLRCQADLWFLTDFERGLWVKEYIIKTDSIAKDLPVEHSIKPLVVLANGRILVHVVPSGLLHIYDPRTNSFDEVGKRCIAAVAMYPGSVLSLPYGDVV